MSLHIGNPWTWIHYLVKKNYDALWDGFYLFINKKIDTNEGTSLQRKNPKYPTKLTNLQKYLESQKSIVGFTKSFACLDFLSGCAGSPKVVVFGFISCNLIFNLCQIKFTCM